MSIEPRQAHRKTRRGSERAFGLVFAGFFLLVAMLPLIKHHEPRLWAFGVAAAFLLAALLIPKLLAPLNWLWFQIGLLLHHVVSPIAMSVIFCLSVVPVGVIARLMGKDFLRLKRDPAARTYWISRDPPGLAPGSMDRQF